MYKFTNRLFVFALLLLALGGSLAQPASGRRNVVSDLLEVLYEDYNDNDFQREDVFYDQRQKGAENLQLSVDGVVIEMAPQMVSSWLYLMAEYHLRKMMLLTTPEPDINELFEDDPFTETAESAASESSTKLPEHANSDLESRQ
ncbi:uncharacterized protein [Drosophila kikkawai]|uniref:Uncharacterized protein n=1 Tax=Drosophila kikkawai TaxID=30033 RepID=A0A6P4HU87_DROKI|nr:uncharacterized protein LOC108072543 [Drosophila kikkawai]